MNLNVTVNDEIFYRMVVAELDHSIASMQDDLRKYAMGEKPNVFYWDEPELDMEKIAVHLDALRLVRSYFSVPE